MEFIILAAVIGVIVLGSFVYVRWPREKLTPREKTIRTMRAAGMRGRLDAIIDLEEQPKRRFSLRVVRRRRK